MNTGRRGAVQAGGRQVSVGQRPWQRSPGVLGMFAAPENHGAPHFSNQDITHRNKEPYCLAAGFIPR